MKGLVAMNGEVMELRVCSMSVPKRMAYQFYVILYDGTPGGSSNEWNVHGGREFFQVFGELFQ